MQAVSASLIDVFSAYRGLDIKVKKIKKIKYVCFIYCIRITPILILTDSVIFNYSICIVEKINKSILKCIYNDTKYDNSNNYPPFFFIKESL